MGARPEPALSVPVRKRRKIAAGPKDGSLKTGSLAPQPAAPLSIAAAIGSQVRSLRHKLFWTEPDGLQTEPTHATTLGIWQ